VQGRGHLTVVHAKDFRAVRDTAFVRLDELAKLHVDDVDLDYDNTATLLGNAGGPVSVRWEPRPPRHSTATDANALGRQRWAGRVV
jgi:hypothetical protein